MAQWNESQVADTKPGNYYVSVINDAGDYRLLSGPYVNNHQAALDAVAEAKEAACKIDPKGFWYRYGTCRLEIADDAGPGILNKHGLMEVRA